MSVNEWIGFGVGALLMGTLVSALVWISGASRGLAPGRLRAALLRIWAAMVACIAGLLLVRNRVGGDLVDYDSAQTAVTTRPVSGQALVWLLLGLAWVIACLVVAVKAAAIATRRSSGTNEPSDATRE